tara:strand:- start:1877 stop:3952 length:2076 start_codon:yes stop_codon:yes gene_type:complete|eukprot:COSAG01_NODE_250_length_20331_cov_203.745700_12_plen_692_part_00
MADPIQQQKDIFSKVQGLIAFLDATDEQRSRENLEQWKQTFAALRDITNNPLPFLLDLLKSLKSHKQNRTKFKAKGYTMAAEKQKTRGGVKGDGIVKKTKKAFSTRFGLSTTSDPWLRQLDQIIRTSMLEVLPRVDDILFEELLKAFNCDMSMLVPVVGDGLNAPLQIEVAEVDLLKQLFNDPASAVGKYMYEQTNWNVGYPPGNTPFSMNLFLRDLIYTTPGVTQTVYGASGRALFDITASAGIFTISPYYKDDPANTVNFQNAPLAANPLATKFTFVEFLKDYFDNVRIIELQNMLGALMEILSGFMSVRNESFSIEDSLGLQKFMSAVENMLESCDGADLVGPNTESVNYLSELYDDDSFFEFNVEEERNIVLEVERKSKNVLSLVSCGQVDIPVDNGVIDDGCDEILASPVIDEQLKAFDLVLQRAASSSASKAGYDISLGSISLPVEIDFKENLIKKMPQILTYCILSSKAILPVVITSRLLNQNGALSTNIELFGKLFKRVIIRVVKEFLARVARHILILVKNILLRLIRDLIKRKLDAMNKKKIRLIRRLLDLLLPLIIALQEAKSCKEIFDILLGVLSANLPDIPFGVPPFLLAASRLKPGYSNLGAFEKFIGKMEAAGLPIGDLPDGSPNQMAKAFFLNGEARDEERIDNEKVKISIMMGQVLTATGPGLIKPGTTGDGGCF